MRLFGEYLFLNFEATLFKEDYGTKLSYEFCQNFKYSYFVKHLKCLLPYSTMLISTCRKVYMNSIYFSFDLILSEVKKMFLIRLQIKTKICYKFQSLFYSWWALSVGKTFLPCMYVLVVPWYYLFSNIEPSFQYKWKKKDRELIVFKNKKNPTCVHE